MEDSPKRPAPRYATTVKTDRGLHHKDYTEMLEKAKIVAMKALNKGVNSSRDVKDIGLPSAISCELIFRFRRHSEINQPIRLIINGRYVKIKGTTAHVSYQLNLSFYSEYLADPDLVLGRLEVTETEWIAYFKSIKMQKKRLKEWENYKEEKKAIKKEAVRVAKMEKEKAKAEAAAPNYYETILHPGFTYRNGWQGFVNWCEDKVCLPIYPMGSDVPVWMPVSELPDDPHPETGRSWKDMWELQKEELREPLRMEDNRFVYRLIVFCWPRGDGKSKDAVLIQLWKFFCWPRQQIVLGANSKDQVKFLHFDEMSDIILNSPRLLSDIGGRENIQQKEIRIKDINGAVASVIKPISSFSGIVSNITGYTFSEFFDMKNPKFFTQLDGSTRNIPNALGVIDSTVSDKQHLLYSLYEGHLKKKIKTLHFSYRSAPKADPSEYWNPMMTQTQLDDYREKFRFGDFERYFQNLWSAGKIKVFSEEMVEGIGILGIDGVLGNHKVVLEALKKKNKLLQQEGEFREKGMDVSAEVDRQVGEIVRRFKFVSGVYKLRTESSTVLKASVDDLARMSEVFDTDWAIGVGLDRDDPMKVRSSARTILTCIAKGLVGSRSNPAQFFSDQIAPNYLYCLIRLLHLQTSSLEEIKRELESCHDDFDGIDAICGERWGLWDLAPWCEDKEIKIEFVHPSYDKQRAAFNELFNTVATGRFKAPLTGVPGAQNMECILREEMGMFDHDPGRSWFGSPEKDQKHGVQDDAIYSTGWNIYGLRELGIDSLRVRGMRKNYLCGFAVHRTDLLGRY